MCQTFRSTHMQFRLASMGLSKLGFELPLAIAHVGNTRAALAEHRSFPHRVDAPNAESIQAAVLYGRGP